MQPLNTMKVLLRFKLDVRFYSKFADAVQLDYKRVSQLFGHGTTYNSIECRFRPVRKLGEKLRNEFPLAQNGSGAAQSTTIRKPRAPRRDKMENGSESCFYTDTTSSKCVHIC